MAEVGGGLGVAGGAGDGFVPPGGLWRVFLAASSGVSGSCRVVAGCFGWLFSRRRGARQGA
jgi:hypothetical protein